MKRILSTAAAVIALTIGAACGTPSHSTTPTPAPTATETTFAAPAAPSKTATAISREQANANQAALDYLDGQSFSRKSLISQLEYEGYSAKVAAIATDATRADWKEQAALSAKDYLDGQTFSRKSLISQLEYEGFTHDQAVYGVTKAGL